MHVANCEYLLLSTSCKMNADQFLFVVDLNDRRSNSMNLVWSILLMGVKFTKCEIYGSTYNVAGHVMLLNSLDIQVFNF